MLCVYDRSFLSCTGSSAYPSFSSSCLSSEEEKMGDFHCETKRTCEEMWCHLDVSGSVVVFRRPGLARLFISRCVSLPPRTSTQAKGANSPTVGSRERPLTPTSFLDAPMQPTQVTPRRPVGLSSAATAGAARRATGFAKGCTRTFAGSWR